MKLISKCDKILIADILPRMEMVVLQLLRRLYAPDYMLKPHQKREEHYNTKEFYKTYLKMAWPAVAESVLLGLVSFVDTIMVSTVGTKAVAAVGLTNQPRFLFFAVFFALGIGVTAIVSRRRGENRREDANKCLAQALSIVLILGGLLVSAAIIFAEPLIIFSGAKEDTLADAVTYFRIIMVGMLFTSISLTINAAQRGAGNTRISMTTNVTANLVNCVFNALLINGLLFFPKLGVVGAAIATLLGNIVSFIMSLVSVFRKDRFLRLRLSELFRFRREDLSIIIKISSSAAVEQVFLRFGFFVTAKLIADLGTVEFSAHTLCMSIATISFCFGDGLGVAASALVGQNLGRERPDYSIIYGKTAQRVGLVGAVILPCLWIFFGREISMLFMTGETDPANIEAILALSVNMLLVLAALTPGQVSQALFTGCIRGSGDTKYLAFVSLACIAIERPLLTYILCYLTPLGVVGAWWAMFVDQYLRLALMAWRFSSGKWAKIKV